MDPSHCTVVVATQPTLPPFNVEGQEIASQNEQPSFTPLLQSIFGQVYVHTGTADAVDRVKRTKNESPTMLLIDVDNATDVNEDEDDDTVHTPSCSSSCSTASSTFVSDSRISWIRKIVRELDIAFMSDIPVVVCSANESSSFMLDCVHAGAADYLIKPLRPDVIKTLFLKLHRCRPDSKMHEQPQQLQHHPHHQHHHNHHHHQQQHHSSRFPSSPPLPPTSLPEHPLSVEPSLCVEEGLQHRIREIYTKDDRLAKSMMDIYITALPMTPAPRTVFRGLSSERAAQLQHKISSWDFSPVDLSHDDLVHCSYLIFEQVLVLPEMSHLSITQDQLYDFIIDLSSAYHDTNPYHNFAHAVDVLQCLYYFLCRLGLLAFANAGTNQERRTVSPYLEKLLRPKDLFALLIAAIGHDAAHPGVNNMFLVNSAAPLALLYNDRSILESFHSMTLFQLVKKHGFDQIGLGLGSSDYHEFRKTVVTCILATDMALHSEYVEKIKAQAQRIHKFNELDDAACESERLLLCSAIIKCADISNVTRPFLRAAKWAELLIEESVSQGDLERALGLPILPLNDRQKVILEDSQIGFIRFVALELFQKVSEVLPEMSFTVDCIQENLRRWEQRKKNAATHDSGVASLGSNGEPEFQITGSKRRNSHAVEVLRKRLSLDTNRSSVSDGRRRSSVASDEVFTLPTMSAVAMESFNHRRLSVSHDDECPWPQQTAHNAETGLPTFCQCIIQ